MSEYYVPTLADQGYIGATGTTPYKPSTADQISQLDAAYNLSFAGMVSNSASSAAIKLNINFDGTQNNGAYPFPGESPTNVWELTRLQRAADRDENTLYLPGVGAQTVPRGTLDANGNPASASSPSSWESTPWKAGAIAQGILEDAYERLSRRVEAILQDNPNAEISLNLAGFSRGGAMAVAFANLLNERGIPGLYEPGKVPINSMVLLDPVDQTAGTLNVQWPNNVKNSLVLVAMNEGRAIMPAMPVGADAIVVGIPGAHADIGGSFNPQGVAAVTLKMARDFLEATGGPVAAIPDNLAPDWQQMYVHNSGLNSSGGVIWSYTDGNRYYEGGGLGSISVQDMLGQGVRFDPVFTKVNGKYQFVALSKTITNDTTDPQTGEHTVSKDITIYSKNAVTVKSRTFESTNTDSTGQLLNRLVVSYKADGVSIISTTLTERLANNNLLITYRDGGGNTLKSVETQTADDSTQLITTTDPSGKTQTLATDPDGQPVSLLVTTPGAYNTETVESYNYANGQTVLSSSKTIETFFDDNGASRIETVTSASGTYRNTYDNEGTLTHSSRVTTTADNLIKAVGTTLEFLTMVKAIQSGQPLPILASGLRLANNLNSLDGSKNLELSGIASAVSGALSLMSLDAALKRGDTLGAITAGAQALQFGAQAFGDLATSQAFNAIEGGTIDLAAETLALESSALTSTLGNALPYLGMVNALSKGDMTGLAVAVAAYFVPVLGQIYAVYSIISSLGQSQPSIPDPWGNASFVWSGNAVGIQSAGQTGGNEAVGNVMNSVLSTLNTLIERERQQNPNSPLGLIPSRMPGLSYDSSGYRYSDINPLTGEQTHPELRFDTAGKPYNATVGSPESYQSLIEAIARSALTRGAIAPLWEVQTAKAQSDAGDPRAGLTEEERAARAGQLAPALNTSQSSQTWRPVMLDLNGNGLETTDQANGVNFDVDDSGYLKQTGWLKPTDGFLVLDRNSNGQTDAAKEMFSNGEVDLNRDSHGFHRAIRWEAKINEPPQIVIAQFQREVVAIPAAPVAVSTISSNNFRWSQVA